MAGFAQSGIISTYAGPGLPVNGSLATAQPLDGPSSLALDGAGGFYVAISGQNNVYRVTADGRITRVAGNNSPGFSGDGGPAVSAQLFHPTGLVLDSMGNLFISDSDNNRIRKVSPDGTISTAAGTGDRGYFRDDDIATAAQLCRPVGLAVDSVNNLYIADSCNNRIRKISNGIISTIAGNGGVGYSADDEDNTDGENDAVNARLNQPMAVAVDSAGIVYIADTANQRIREIKANGDIATIGGNGEEGSDGDGGSATSAQFNYPIGIALDSSGNVYVADAYNYRVRKMTVSGSISTVAGSGVSGFGGDGGKATSAQISFPTGLAVDSSGNLFIADYVNRRVREVKADGNITTIAGIGTQGFSGDGGLATSAQFYLPAAVALDKTGNLFIADSSNSRVRKVSTAGIISTVAGDGNKGFSGDGSAATSAKLYSPVGVAVDSTGTLYIADSINQRVRKVTSDGVISTVAGNGTPGFSGDGSSATSAQLSHPWGVAVDSAGSLYIADTVNHRIRKVTSSGAISTVAGAGIAGYGGDGSVATLAQLQFPAGVTVDSAGNLYISDFGNNCIRKVTSAGIISTVAGTGAGEFSGDGGQATSAGLNGPTSVFVDAAGNMFIVDHLNSRIRKVTSSGVISTFAGIGTAGFSGDGGTALLAQLNNPMGIAGDNSGNLFVADYDNNRIRKIAINATANFFPQVAIGSGYSTLFTISNTDTKTATGVLRLTDPQGNPLGIRATVTDAAGIAQTVTYGSAFALTVPAQGRVFITASELESGTPVQVGWGELESSQSTLAGAVTFVYPLNSMPQTVMGALQSQTLESATLAVENDGSQGKWVAYAIANPGDQIIPIEMSLTGQDGAVIGETVSFTIGPKQQVARYLSQDLALTEFKGSLAIRTRAGATFVGVALLDNQGLLTALPLESGKTQASTK